MDALRALLQPAVAMVNRQIAESTPARELCDELDGKSVAIRVRGAGLAICLAVAGRRLEFRDLAATEPDVVLTGSLIALGGLAGENGEELIRSGRIDLTGDAGVADDFRRLLGYGKPDWEEQLSGVIGDTAAHGLGNIIRDVARWGRDAKSTMEQNVGEYLQEESRALPSRYEVDQFRADVQRLRDDVARAEARIALLEAGSAGNPGAGPAR